MHHNSVQSQNSKSLLQFPKGIRMARLLSVAAAALGMAASLSPKPVHAQEYPWCVSRESYLYCFYKAMSVDSIGHRRLRFESAFAFPEQVAGFRPRSIESH